MNFQAVVFKPGQAGEVVTISAEDFSTIVGGIYERAQNKHYVPNSVVIVNEEGALIELPRNRGYYGTFIVVKEDEFGDEYLSFTDKEVEEMKALIDNKPNFVSKSKYLATFFEEKNLPVAMFTYVRGMNTITLSNYDIIEDFLAIRDTNHLKEIENIIRKIDFANGDVNHFVHHMGNAIADHIDKQSQSFFG